MSVSINGTSGLVFNDASTQNTSAFTGGLGFRNRIINGAMMIDQRNAGASVTPTTDNTYTLDRWTAKLTQSSKFSVQQSSTAPAGFKNSLLITSLSAYSVVSSDQFGVKQVIEGLNVADFGWGTANAQTVTLSFKVRSSLTGTFGGSVFNSDGSRCYPFSYTIASANTDTALSITIAGDTSGTWLTTNGAGINIYFSVGAGSSNLGTAGSWGGTLYLGATGQTSVVGTNGATFYITGVQLEKGSTATSFDYRPYGTELALCQRYYYRMVATGSGRTSFLTGGVSGSTTAVYCAASFPVPMRTAPSSTYSGVNISDANINAPITSITVNLSSTTNASLNITCSGGGLTAGRPASVVTSSSTSDFIDFSSEL